MISLWLVCGQVRFRRGGDKMGGEDSPCLIPFRPNNSERLGKPVYDGEEVIFDIRD